MGKKLVFLLVLSLLLTGCSGSAPAENGASGGSVSSDYAAAPEMERSGGTEGEPCEDGELIAPQSAEEEDFLDATSKNTAPVESAAEADSESNYFIFNRESTAETSADGTELLFEYKCDSEFYSMDPELKAWVDSILEEIRQDYASDSANLLEEANLILEDYGDGFHGFSNYQELSVGRHDGKVASINVLSSVYSGGAHSNTVQTSWNLDLETQKVLRLEDVLEKDSEAAMADLVQSHVDAKFQPLGEGALFEGYSETIESAFRDTLMTPYWYFSGTGLVIYFNPYELAPFAAGIIKVEIPYTSLDGILREEYFPGQYAQIPGELLLRKSPDEGTQNISITVEQDGDLISVGANGNVYQMQLSQVSWLEGTIIGQQILFSTNCLTENETLEIVARFDEEDQSLAVEFQDGEGNTCVYYLHPEGLSDKP